MNILKILVSNRIALAHSIVFLCTGSLILSSWFSTPLPFIGYVLYLIIINYAEYVHWRDMNPVPLNKR